MKTYRIPVLWQMMGFAYVKAENLDDAVEIAIEGGLPSNGEYLDGSFEIDYEGIDPEDAEEKTV